MTAALPEVHVIAEAGTNHNGRVDTALKLANAAQEAGADSVKFQMIFPAGLYLPSLWQDGKLTENTVFAARTRAALSGSGFSRIAGHCKSIGIPFSASVFDRAGLDLLRELEAPYIKLASCDLNNGPLLRMAAERGRRLILSTGMSSLGEIETAVRTVLDTGNRDLVLMHCVSVYPCPVEITNLGFLDTLKSAFGLPVGFSDHTQSSIAAAIAVSKGVTWIEKHFTLDRKDEGFDHAYAAEPATLTAYVADIRSAIQACAPGQPKTREAEAGVRKRARRALYAARDLAPLEVVREEDVLIVRPEGPMEPNDLHRVVGASARRAVRRYEPFSPDALIAKER